jgi:hypothetical protein
MITHNSNKQLLSVNEFGKRPFYVLELELEKLKSVNLEYYNLQELFLHSLKEERIIENTILERICFQVSGDPVYSSRNSTITRTISFI